MIFSFRTEKDIPWPKLFCLAVYNCFSPAFHDNYDLIMFHVSMGSNAFFELNHVDACVIGMGQKGKGNTLFRVIHVLSFFRHFKKMVFLPLN